MNLYLMQHGLATSAEENPDRPLTDVGRGEIADEAALVGGRATVELGQLGGRALKTSGIGMFASGTDDTSDRAVAEWIVRAPAGTAVAVVAHHDRAGVVRVDVDLG